MEIVGQRHLRALGRGGVRIGDGELFGQLFPVNSGRGGNLFQNRVD